MNFVLLVLSLTVNPSYAQKSSQDDLLSKPYKLDKVVIDIEYRNKKKFLKREKLKQEAIIQILRNEKEKAITSFRTTVVSQTDSGVTETQRNSEFQFKSRFTSKLYIVSMNEIQCPYREISDEVMPGLFKRHRKAQLEITCTIFPIVSEERKKRTLLPGEVKKSETHASYNECVDLFEKYNADYSKVSELAFVGKLKTGCGRCILNQTSNGTDNYQLLQYQTLSPSSPYHYLKPSSTGDVSSTDRGNESWLTLNKQLYQIDTILLQGYCNPDSAVY